MRRRLLIATLVLLAAGGPARGLAGPSGDPVDPWQALAQLRLHLAASGALVGDFVQTFVPAGFASGEEESGRVALAIPDCLRWDYLTPYRKSYLLCGPWLHSWVEGEPRGQRVHVDLREQSGLDLLLLPVGELMRRYRASARTERGEIVVELEPTDAARALERVTIAFDPASQRPTALAYGDREGNATRFRFLGFRSIEDPDLFSPPGELEWTEP